MAAVGVAALIVELREARHQRVLRADVQVVVHLPVHLAHLRRQRADGWARVSECVFKSRPG